jgi:hypothetical protein
MASGTTVTGSKLRLGQYLNNNNILGFAVRNHRDRFLVPSSQNLFGGILTEYVLIDSGSNSSLLPLPTTPEKNFDVRHLIKNFPHDKYVWSIGTVRGVGLLNDTTLHIKPKQFNNLPSFKIKCSLHMDIKSLDFELPYVRFSLDKQSIKILSETTEIPFADVDEEILANTLSFLNEFENHFPMMINNKKRDYCLLGQHFLTNICSLQLNDVIIFIDKNKLQEKLFPPQTLCINDIADYLYYQRPAFSRTENFLNCEDDEHGGRDLFNISHQHIDIDEYDNHDV